MIDYRAENKRIAKLRREAGALLASLKSGAGKLTYAGQCERRGLRNYFSCEFSLSADQLQRRLDNLKANIR